VLLDQPYSTLRAQWPSWSHEDGPTTAAGRPRIVRASRVKGAQTRSCGLSVLVEQAAKQVASLHSAAVILAQDGQPGGWVWRFQPKRPVGTVAGSVALAVRWPER